MDVKTVPPPGGGNRREQAGEATRAALIEVSRGLFAERGYADVSIEDITQRTGVTRGALYHHFSDKRDLFQAVVETVEQELAEEVRRKAAQARSPWGRLSAACDAYLDASLRPEFQRIVVLDGPPILSWRTWCDIDKRHGLGLFEQHLAAARDAGLITLQSVETAALLLLGALNTGAHVVADAADKAAARRDVGATIDRILSGFRAGGRTPRPGGA